MRGLDWFPEALNTGGQNNFWRPKGSVKVQPEVQIIQFQSSALGDRLRSSRQATTNLSRLKRQDQNELYAGEEIEDK